MLLCVFQTDMHSSASSGGGSHGASVDGDHAHRMAHAPPTSVVSSSVPPSPLQLTVATSRAVTPEALSPASIHTPFGHEGRSRPATAGMDIQAPYGGSQRASSGAADLNADTNPIKPGSLQVIALPCSIFSGDRDFWCNIVFQLSGWLYD